MSTFFKINGINMPIPATGLSIKRIQFVDSARNANGQIVAQKINRRIYKLDAVVWRHLTATQWRAILVEIEKFEGTLTFWNNLNNAIETIKVYWGDASETVFKIDDSTGEVLEYLDCKCNIIDMGY